MSLINQMLRDLQERRDSQAAGPYAKLPARSRRPRRHSSMIGPLRSLPPLLWVGVGGVAGLALLWGVSGWVSGTVGPAAPVPPPPELVAVVESQPPVPAAVPATPQRVAPVPIEVPPPTPPLAYGAGASVENVPVATVTAVPPPAPVPAQVSFKPATAVSQGSTAFFSDRPAPLAGAPTGGEEGLFRASGSAQQPARVPVRPLPEGVIRAADLALQQKTGMPATAAPYPRTGQEQALDPDPALLRKRTARSLLDRGDVTGAVRALTNGGLPHIETDPELHRMLAALYLKLGETFLAAQTYRNLAAYNPRDGASWLGLGDVLAADGRIDEAREAYRKALEVGGLSREEAERLRNLVSH